MLEFVTYKGRDNNSRLQLLSDKLSVDHTTFTKLELVFGSTIISSTFSSSLFSFTTNYVDIKIGQSILPAGEHIGKIIAYTALTPNGICWGDVKITVLN